MNKYVMEFIGTFFLMLTIGLVVIEPGAGAMAPLAIGSILMVMIYAGGHISGAHYNPAVTLAIWMRGKCDSKDVPFYMISQFFAAVVAAMTLKVFKDESAVVAAVPDAAMLIVAEILFTFALAFVILNVATSKATEGNQYFGLAIGFTVAAGAYAVGPVSGAAFNPAVALGVTMVGLSELPNLWLFFVANFTGGALAAVTFKALHPGE